MCSENGIVLALNWQPLQEKGFAAFPTSHTQHNASASVMHASQYNRPASSSTKYKGNLLIELLNHYVNIAMLCTTCNERQLIEFHYLSHDGVIDQRYRVGGNRVPALQLGQLR